MLFSDPFREFDFLTNDLLGGRSRSQTQAIPMAAWRDENSLQLEFELPGVAEDNINLEIDQNVLTLAVDKPYQEISGSALINERSFGLYKRMLRLNENLDTEAVEAKLENGLLKLRIPLVEKAKPRRISIGSAREKELEASS